MSDRLRHHRTRDHIGMESAMFTVLEDPFGPYDSDTPIQLIVEDLLTRIERFETSDQVRNSFRIDAILLGPGVPVGTSTVLNVFFANAVLTKTIAPTFTIQAWLTEGASFTINAVIQGGGTFSINARIV